MPSDEAYDNVDALILAISTGDPWLIAAASVGAAWAVVQGYLSYKKRKRVIVADATNKEELPGPK